MAQTFSFDVSTGADLQEVDNAVNQARKEVQQRYDFKGTSCTITFDRDAATLVLEADDAFRMRALYDVLHGKLVKRRVPVQNLRAGEDERASGDRVRRTIAIAQGLSSEVAKDIVTAVKAHNFRKVQAAIQGDQVRISSPSKDALQEVIAFLRGRDFGVALTFGNYRA